MPCALSTHARDQAMMRWWGKGVGATFGWVAGGPWGALVGLLLGNSADAATPGDSRWRDWGVPASPSGWYPALFAVLGHVARADGRVSATDIRFAESLIQRLRLDARQRRHAIRAYNQGRVSGFRPEPSLMRLRAATIRDRRLADGLLAVLVAAAGTEGVPSDPLIGSLERHASLLGVSPGRLEALLAEQGVVTAGAELREARAILGVGRNATDAEIKASYRRLINRHHPDRLGADAGAGRIGEATRRTAEIRRAWERLRDARGIR